MKSNKDLINTFQALNLNDGKYLIAFSGGPDSVYLLEALASFYQEDLKNKVSLCYINYHDSPYVKQEEEIVLNYVLKHDLTIYRKDTKHRKRDGNFEEWARKYRYRYFKKIVKNNGYIALITAHQKNDDIETYLLQKERGNLPLHYGLQVETELAGLKILRPLLNISKNTIISSLNKEHLPYYDDITNKDDHARRNTIRKELTEENKKTLLKEKNTKNKELISLYKRFDTLNSPYTFNFYNSLSEDEQRRFIFYFLSFENFPSTRRVGIGKEVFEFLKKQTNGYLTLSDKKCLYKTKDIFFIHDDYSKISYSFKYSKSGKYNNKYFSVDLRDISLFKQVQFPVEIRNAKPTDVISTDLPTKNVFENLKKQQVPSFLWSVYPVFVCNDQIKYVPFYKNKKSKSVPVILKLL